MSTPVKYRYPNKHISFTICFLLLFIGYGHCQITEAFLQTIPDSLRPVNRLNISSEETKKLMSYTFLFDAQYHPEIKKLVDRLAIDAAKEPDRQKKIDDYSALSIYYSNAGYYDTSLLYCNRLLALLGKHQTHTPVYLKTRTRMGYLLSLKNEYEKSIPVLRENLDLYLQKKDSLGITNISMYLVDIYAKLELIEEEIHMLHLAEKYMPQDNLWPEGMRYIRMAWVSTFILLYKKYNTGSYLDTAEGVIQKVLAEEDAIRWMSYAYNNLSAIKILRGQYQQAINYCDSALLEKYLLKDPNPAKAAIAIAVNKNYCYLKTNRKEEGYRQLQNIIKTDEPVLKTSWASLYLPLLEEMYRYARSNNHWKEALDYQELYRSYKDTLNILQNRGVVFKINQKYDLAAKESRIQALQYENTRQKNGLIYAAILTLLLLTIIILVFRGRQRRLWHEKMLAEKAVEEQKLIRQRELVQMETKMLHQQQNAIMAQRKQISEDMHDDLSSSLAGLKFYIADLTSTARVTETRDLLQHVAVEIDTIYKNARQYIHNLGLNAGNPDYDLVAYLQELSDHATGNKSFTLNLGYDTCQLKTFLNTGQQYHLYHIIREMVANIIKHSKASLATIDLRFEGHYCTLVVHDNGAGFEIPTAGNLNGIGLQSITNRAESLGGAFSIQSGQAGTTLTIRFLSGK